MDWVQLVMLWELTETLLRGDELLIDGPTNDDCKMHSMSKGWKDIIVFLDMESLMDIHPRVHTDGPGEINTRELPMQPELIAKCAMKITLKLWSSKPIWLFIHDFAY